MQNYFKILQESYNRAKGIVERHEEELKLIAEALLKYETLSGDDVKTIIAGKTLQRNQPVTDHHQSSINRPAANQPDGGRSITNQPITDHPGKDQPITG